MPTLTASERIGTTIGGRYELRRLIGEGGFSAVFEAVHSITGREVALKILHSHLTATEQIAERFLMEARAMARIKHDGIVQVLDAGTDPDGSVFIALELLDGESLESTLLRVHQLTWGEAVTICVAVLDALAEAHRHKIVHRDIKPGNIFIVRKPDGSSQAKLLDFGIAHVTQNKSKLTAAGMILGTPEYMSPEQGRSASVGPESDLWSVGIVMWECLTGHTPFVAETATEILLRIATSDAPSILTEVPDLPPPIAAVIDRSLVRDVTQRFRSADEMREAMQRAMRKVDEAASAPTRPASRTSPPVRRDPEPAERRKGVARTDVVNVDALAKVPVGAPPMQRSPARVVSGDAGARASTAAIPIGERPTPRNIDVGRPVSVPQGLAPGALQRSPGPAESRPINIVEKSSPAIALPPDESEARVRVVSSEAKRPIPSPTPQRLAPSESEAAPQQTPVPLTATPPREPEVPISEATRERRPSPSPPSQARTQTLGFDDRESRSFSGQKGTFQKPPESRRPPVGLVAAGVASLALIGAGVYLSLRGDSSSPPDAGHVNTSPRGSSTANDAQSSATDPSHGTEPPSLTLVSINDVQLPQGVTGADNATEFVRHAAASYHAGSTQRMIATCIPSEEGATLYLHPMTPGTLRGSSRGFVACAGYDLGVVPDITADGSDDVVAVGARRGQLLLIDSRTLRPHRTIEVEGARGLASGAQVIVRGEPVMVVYAEPRGSSAPTEVLAITALSSRVLWRIRSTGRIARVGHPIELGLAVGPDASGDGVGDVVAGLGGVLDATENNSGSQRCAQLFSGADGRSLWAQPFCRARSRGAQSVSLGPDVNGDGKADVVVGTDQPAAGGAPVVILSGADGSIIRQIASPPGGAALGFGWPVALGGDVDGNGTPDLFVGTVGSQTSVRVFDATTGAPLASLALSGVGAGNLRVFPVPTLVAESPWSVAIASPGEGIRVLSRRDTEEPL